MEVAPVTNYAELMKGIPDMFHPVSRTTSASRPSTRRTSTKSAPNLLYRSLLGSAAKKGFLPDCQSPEKRLTYSSSGHRCWSSLKTREWQELQRMMNEDTLDKEFATSTTSYFYFASPNVPSRASRRASRKQVGSPDSDFYEKERLSDFRRIEDAWEHIKSSKHQKRIDFLAGVPHGNPDDKQRGFSEYSETLDTESKHGMSEAHDTKDHTTSRPQTQRTIPPPYVFPKPSDFVPPKGTKLAEVGVDWRYAKCHREKSTSIDHVHGKIYRIACPVTEGLCKEQTSVSKVQGKALMRGEWDVSKLWNRKITEIINPAEMARQDVNLKQMRKISKKNQKENKRKDTEKNIKDDTLSLEAESFNKTDSGDNHSVVSST